MTDLVDLQFRYYIIGEHSSPASEIHSFTRLLLDEVVNELHDLVLVRDLGLRLGEHSSACTWDKPRWNGRWLLVWWL